jgi:hypothetical protein
MDDSESRKFLRQALLVEALKIEAINISDLTTDMADPRTAIYRAGPRDCRRKLSGPIGALSRPVLVAGGTVHTSVFRQHRQLAADKDCRRPAPT